MCRDGLPGMLIAGVVRDERDVHTDLQPQTRGRDEDVRNGTVRTEDFPGFVWVCQSIIIKVADTAMLDQMVFAACRLKSAGHRQGIEVFLYPVVFCFALCAEKMPELGNSDLI